MSTDEQRRALSRLVFQWRTEHPEGSDDPNDDPDFLRQARVLQGLDPETGARSAT